MQDLKFSFYVPFYMSKIVVIVSDDVKEACSTHLGYQCDATYDGLTVYRGNVFSMVLSRRKLNHELVCHELYHVVHRLMELMNTKAGPDNHEPFAYLQGYIGGRILKEFAKRKVRL